jgi:hypothetical protein
LHVLVAHAAPERTESQVQVSIEATGGLPDLVMSPAVDYSLIAAVP